MLIGPACLRRESSSLLRRFRPDHVHYQCGTQPWNFNGALAEVKGALPLSRGSQAYVLREGRPGGQPPAASPVSPCGSGHCVVNSPRAGLQGHLDRG